MFLRQIFDPSLAQYAYLIGCQKTGEAIVIDPERDVDRYVKIAEENELRLTAVAETHIHADFVSGARELANIFPEIRLYLSGEGGDEWSYRWPEGNANLRLLKHGDRFKVGNIEIEAVHTPGHTPEHLSFLITDSGGGADEPIALATGDFLFVGDVGRPDLLETAAGSKGVMEPSARRLQASLAERLSGFADHMQILPGHGAGSACGKSLGAVPVTTMGYERRFNKALRGASENPGQFVRDILSGQPDPPLYFAMMKRVNRDGIAVTGGVKMPPKLDANEALRYATETAGRILDLRTDRDAFAASHLKGAIHAPFGTAYFLMAAGSYVGEDERILLVVEEQAQVEEAARQLYRIGLDGVIGWVAAAEVAGSLEARLPCVDFQEFDEGRAKVDGAILDVRTTSEYDAGHMDGAISVPYTRLRGRFDEVPRDKTLFVHCGTGRRAGLAASYLQSEGLNVVLVDGVCSTCERIAAERGITN